VPDRAGMGVRVGGLGAGASAADGAAPSGPFRGVPPLGGGTELDGAGRAGVERGRDPEGVQPGRSETATAPAPGAAVVPVGAEPAPAAAVAGRAAVPPRLRAASSGLKGRLAWEPRRRRISA